MLHTLEWHNHFAARLFHDGKIQETRAANLAVRRLRRALVPCYQASFTILGR